MIKLDYMNMMFEAMEARKSKNHEKEIKIYESLAEKGYAPAQHELGWLYQESLGVKRDIKKAVEWYGKAVNQGHARSQNNLAMIYENYRDLHEIELIDYEKMLELYIEAAVENDQYALYNLGRIYENGIYVEQDYGLALKFYERSKAEGYLPAKHKYDKLNRRLKHD
ncbi:MAG: sel1 repeat family protein [Endozoicomonadaceae bacterium]|nr:sel1 repeat family protein [Endozoicomonadaceae bacterium]